MSVSPDTIIVRLFAGLESRVAGRCSQLCLTPADAPTVAAVQERLGLGGGATGIVLVNGVHARPDRALEAGDEVSLFPPLGGG